MSIYPKRNHIPLTKCPALSLVICIDKLPPTFEKSLELFLDQDYPKYQLIIIDNSPDFSVSRICQPLITDEQKIKIYKHKKEPGEGKKSAVLKALSINVNPYILFTDSDCVPQSKRWISQMMSKMISDQADIVLGYSPYCVEKSDLRNYWIHYEGLFTAIQYLSYSLKKCPYMGVGRNILYREGVLSSEVINKHMDLKSGDDDLSVNQLSSNSKISICIEEDSFVFTFPESSWKKYIKQKSRHFSTAHRYRLLHTLLLSTYSLSHFLFYVSAIIILLWGNPLISVFAVLLRCAFIIPISKKLRKTLNSPINTSMFLFLDFVHIIFYMFFALSVVFPQKSKW